MIKITTTVLLLIGTAGFCLAGAGVAPEIDANSAMSGLVLVSAALVMIRGRRKS